MSSQADSEDYASQKFEMIYTFVPPVGPGILNNSIIFKCGSVYTNEGRQLLEIPVQQS